jgi:hypothetical protein
MVNEALQEAKSTGCKVHLLLHVKKLGWKLYE